MYLLFRQCHILICNRKRLQSIRFQKLFCCSLFLNHGNGFKPGHYIELFFDYAYYGFYEHFFNNGAFRRKCKIFSQRNFAVIFRSCAEPAEDFAEFFLSSFYLYTKNILRRPFRRGIRRSSGKTSRRQNRRCRIRRA